MERLFGIVSKEPHPYMIQHSHDSSVVDKEEYKVVGIYESEALAKEAISRLCLQSGSSDIPDYFFMSKYDLGKDDPVEDPSTYEYEPIWAVWRQDDNGNCFLVRFGLTESDALLLVRDFEKRGHKQTYWAKQNRRFA